jgi:hypothetical protein
MNRTTSQYQQNAMTRDISIWYRRILAVIGLMSWVAGGAVSFRTTNGAGAALGYPDSSRSVRSFLNTHCLRTL